MYDEENWLILNDHLLFFFFYYAGDLKDWTGISRKQASGWAKQEKKFARFGTILKTAWIKVVTVQTNLWETWNSETQSVSISYTPLPPTSPPVFLVPVQYLYGHNSFCSYLP